MGLKSRLIKHIVKNNTYDVLMGAFDGIVKFVNELYRRFFHYIRLYINNGQKPKVNTDTYTEAETVERQMNKKYSKKGNQDGVLF